VTGDGAGGGGGAGDSRGGGGGGADASRGGCVGGGGGGAGNSEFLILNSALPKALTALGQPQGASSILLPQYKQNFDISDSLLKGSVYLKTHPHTGVFTNHRLKPL